MGKRAVGGSAVGRRREKRRGARGKVDQWTQ